MIDANAKRRIHPGTKAADMAAGPPLIPLNELDSAFQLQEHLAALHYYHTGSNTQPVSRDAARLLATPPPSIDRNLWLYELCRFLIAQCNSLIVGFLFDTPPCSAATCPEMRASEWQFLCAVHDQPKSCCAIDYCCHTLDWAANVVTNPKLFPSRFVALSATDGQHGDRSAALKNLVNVFRRLHRIFAHAWFQHRGVFWSVEGQTGLYVLFKTVCDLYDLLPAENYKLPPEAEGLEAPGSSEADRKPQPAQIVSSRSTQRVGEEGDENFAPVGRTNTRRHIRSNPSTGSAVTTVMEADEDDSGDVTRQMRGMHISAPEIVEEESEVAEVPVIVEHGMMDDATTPLAKEDEPAKETLEEQAEPGENITILEREHEESSENKSVEAKEDAPAVDAREIEATPESQEDVTAQSEPLQTLSESKDGGEAASTSTHDFAEQKAETATDDLPEPAPTPVTAQEKAESDESVEAKEGVSNN